MEELKMPPEIKPVYCDEFRINTIIKVNMDEKDSIRKQGHLDIIFFDNVTKTVVERIVLNPITAQQLAQAITQNVESYNKGMDKKETPDELKKMMNKAKQDQETAAQPIKQAYIG